MEIRRQVMIYMKVALVVLAIIAIVIWVMLLDWAGKCKKCGSWKNYLETTAEFDSRHSHIAVYRTFALCSVCENKEHRFITESYLEREHS